MITPSSNTQSNAQGSFGATLQQARKTKQVSLEEAAAELFILKRHLEALESENFAELQDLLGGTGYLDIDFFADEGDDSVNEETLGTFAQSDVRNRNRIVTEGERYKYNYEIDANVVSGFAQAQFKYNRVDFYLAGDRKSVV